MGVDDLLGRHRPRQAVPGAGHRQALSGGSNPPEGAAPGIGAEVRKPKDAGGSLRIKDLEDLLMRLATCCQPIPGDPIMGYITRGQGVTIHRADCAYLARTECFRQIPAEWDGGGPRNSIR